MTGNHTSHWSCAALAAGLFVTFALHARATTYYVSNSGNDSNTGTSQTTTWKTLAKVNATTFAPGDQVLFQRGGVWREQLKPNCDGTTANPIVFGAYGSGNKPRFLGTDILANGSFVLDQGSTYTYTTPYPIDRHATMTIDGIPLAYVGIWANGVDVHNAVYNTPYSAAVEDGWPSTTWSDHAIIHVNTGGSNPASDGKVYGGLARQNLIYSDYRSYLTFNDLVVAECPGIEQFYGVRVMGGTGVHMARCEAIYIGAVHFGIVGSQGFVGDDLLADQPMPGQNYQTPNAFWVQLGATATFNNCRGTNLVDTLHNNAKYNVVGCTDNNGGSVTFNNLTCVGSTAGNMVLMGDVAVTVNGGALDDCYIQQFAGNSHFNGVHFRGRTYFDCYSSGNVYENCLFENSSAAQGSIFGYRGGANNNIIRFNTFLNTSGVPIVFMGSYSGDPWYGNIFVGSTEIAQGAVAANSSGTDYNFYPNSPTFNYASYATWKAGGVDAHSLTGNPLFVGGADYSLQAASPCRDAAGGASVIPSTDIQGLARPQGSAADMGAYEYGGAPVAPVITSSTTANGTVTQPFTYQITATGSPTNYTATGLPAGLSVNTSNGLISGTPTAVGTNSVSLSAAGAGGTGTATLTITISAVPLSQPVYRINCGGGAASPFAADQYFNGGGSYSTASTIDMSGVTDPAPMAVYQSERYTSGFGYDFSNLTASASYKVRLHFAELYFTATNQRVFNISLNGTQVMTNFDVVAATGAGNKAIVKEFTIAATGGQINLWFAAVKDNPKISGIEIWTVDSSGVQAPLISAMRPTGNKPELGWTSVAGVTYAVYKSTNLVSGWIVTPLTNIAGDGTAKTFADPSPTQPAAFYRVTAR